MKYLPLSDGEKSALLSEFKVNAVDDLFRSLPASVRLSTSERLDSPLSEIEIRERFRDNVGSPSIRVSYMGGNGHHHYIPSVIDPIISRGEFLTAYTPYQPEVSQGTLQAMFEFQSMMADLMGVEVSNASLYDGSTAMLEAALMAARITKKNRILVSSLLHPQYIETLQTYAETSVLEYELIPASSDGRTDSVALRSALAAGNVGAVIVATTNFHGIIEDYGSIAAIAREAKAMSVAVVTEAISLALLKSPGACGFDIVCGEAQSLGIPVSFGGPWLGFIGTSMQHVRNLPGRLVGETKDVDGRRAFVVTLAAREQHIRREKATSNICTNQGLMALRASIYMSVMGKHGLRRAAERSAKFAQHGRSLIAQKSGVTVLLPASPIFNEFVIETTAKASEVFSFCVERAGIAPGTVIGSNRLLCAFNEMMSPEGVALWANTVSEACAK